MTQNYRKVYVHKVPSIKPDDRMHDKLLIHFLRPRNGGGEVLELFYPTEDVGVAIVTFELEEVADRILRRPHTLELNSKRYPLEVRRYVETAFKTQEVGFSLVAEDYMTVRTILDFRLLPETNTVKMLVEKFGLRVCSETDDAMEIEGVFPALTKLNNELLCVLSYRENLQCSPGSTYSPTLAKQNSITSEIAVRTRTPRENEKRPAPQGLQQYPPGKDYIRTLGVNRSPTSKFSYESSVSNFTGHGGSLSLPVSVQGYGVTTGSGHVKDYATDQKSLLHEKPFGTLPLTQNSKGNQAPKSNSLDYYSPSSPMHCKNPLGAENFLDSVENPILQQQGRVSDFINVDGDTLKYIKAFKKEELDMILNFPLVEMSLVDQGELSLVTLTSNHATSAEMENVFRKLRNLLSTTEVGLRTHDISLTGLSPEKKLLINERSKELSNQYNSVAVSYKDRLHLIGPSQKVFLLKQRLIDDCSLFKESPKEQLAGARGRRDRSCPASREKRTADSDYVIGDTRSYPEVQSRARQHEIAENRIHESSTDLKTHKNKRLPRGHSLQRTTSRESQRAPDVGQGSDLSNHNPGERGRERSKNFIKRSLGKFDCDTFKEKLKFTK